MKEIETNPGDMTRAEILNELKYWSRAQFAGPETAKRVKDRVWRLEDELRSR